MDISMIHPLGKRELGPYAFEERLPAHLQTLIEQEDIASHSAPGVIDNLVSLLRNDGEIETAYLCTRHAVQISKLPEEGAHFCGYRNLQMTCLALTGSSLSRPELSVPLTIPRLQEMIEAAWAKGFNAHGKILTGGIKGTRKHIGTSEAEALLLSLDVCCTGTVCHSPNTAKQVLDVVEGFFAANLTSSGKGNPSSRDQPHVHVTNCLPVFLQGPAHSITIVGLEKLKSGSRRLLTFDPGWQIPSAMRTPFKLGELGKWRAWWLLQRYRKSERYFTRRRRFEVLVVHNRRPVDCGSHTTTSSEPMKSHDRV